MPSITELVCELGLADQLVGRTGFCIHPKETLKKIPKVGGTKSVNLKKIRELAPTHVIVNVDENRKETADALAEFVPNVIVTHPLAPLDNLALYRQIGSAFGKEREAEVLCSKFEAAVLENRKTKISAKKVLYLIWKDPWMTVSRDTYVSRMLALFGLQTLPEAACALSEAGQPGRRTAWSGFCFRPSPIASGKRTGKNCNGSSNFPSSSSTAR